MIKRNLKLLIDTTNFEKLKVALIDQNGKAVVQLERDTEKISETLLPEIEKLLRKQKVNLADISAILVNPRAGGFSSTRTGVATANALAYALGIPVASWPRGKKTDLVLPKYKNHPHITYPKKP